MLPQSKNTKEFLERLLEENKNSELKTDIEKLLSLLECNE